VRLPEPLKVFIRDQLQVFGLRNQSQDFYYFARLFHYWLHDGETLHSLEKVLYAIQQEVPRIRSYEFLTKVPPFVMNTLIETLESLLGTPDAAKKCYNSFKTLYEIKGVKTKLYLQSGCTFEEWTRLRWMEWVGSYTLFAEVFAKCCNRTDQMHCLLFFPESIGSFRIVLKRSLNVYL
jgi:hypothetical protein